MQSSFVCPKKEQTIQTIVAGIREARAEGGRGHLTDVTCRSTGRGPIILHEELRAGWLEKEAADSRGLLGF